MNQLLKLLSKFDFMIFGRFEFEVKQHNITITNPNTKREIEISKIEWVINRQELGDEPYSITIWGVDKRDDLNLEDFLSYKCLSDEDKEKVRSAIFLEMLETDNSNL